MNSDQNNRTNRDQDQMASEQADASNPRSAGGASPKSHNDYDQAERQKALDRTEADHEKTDDGTTFKRAGDQPDDQEGSGP